MKSTAFSCLCAMLLLVHAARGFRNTLRAKNQHLGVVVLEMLPCKFQSFRRTLSQGLWVKQEYTNVSRKNNGDFADLGRKRIAVRPTVKLQTKSLAYNDDEDDDNNDNNNVKSLEEEIRCSLSRNVSPIISETVNGVVMVVGVSGGCDSVGLLHGLVRGLSSEETEGCNDRGLYLPLKSKIVPCCIHVIHFDHQLRGAESDGDRILVEQLCKNYGLPFHCYYWKDVHSKTTDTSFSQDSARVWRRSRSSSLLQGLAKKDQLGFILTAHHADDSMESLLLKLLRGSHITNISGMEPITQDTDSNWIVRPLLNVRKNDIMGYLKGLGLGWREDSSNASDKYLRNRVRNQLVPLLSDIVGGDEILQRRLQNLSRQSKEVRHDLKSRAARYLQNTSSTDFFTLPSSAFELVHKEALHLWVSERTRHQFTYGHLERVCEQLSNHSEKLEWRLSIGRGYDIAREGNRLRLLCTAAETAKDSPEIAEDEMELKWEEVPMDYHTDSALQGVELLVSSQMLDAIGGFFVTKVRDNNHQFTPPWRRGRTPSKISQFLRGQQVPLHERRETQLIYAFKSNGEKLAVAVKLPTTGEIVLNAAFTTDNENDDDVRRIFVAFSDEVE